MSDDDGASIEVPTATASVQSEMGDEDEDEDKEKPAATVYIPDETGSDWSEHDLSAGEAMEIHYPNGTVAAIVQAHDPDSAGSEENE